MSHEPVTWRAHVKLEKRREGVDEPYEVLEEDGNLLVHGGASVLWHRLTGGNAVLPFSSTNAHIGVGDGTTAEAYTQTALQGSSQFRRPMDTGYPIHVDGTGPTNGTVTFKSTFTATQALFAWNEWGIFNAATGGRMLNRKVASFGTKPSGDVWTLSVELSIT